MRDGTRSGYLSEHTGLGVANEEMVILYGNTGYTLDRNEVLRRRLLKLNLWGSLWGIDGRHDQTCNELWRLAANIYRLLTSSGNQGAMRNSGPALGSCHHVTCLIRQVCDVVPKL